MSIQDCLELPDLLSKLPEVGYSIMNKGINLRARAAHIQAQIDYLKQDLAVFQGDLELLWSREDLAGAGL
jgi:hypothetical protein